MELPQIKKLYYTFIQLSHFRVYTPKKLKTWNMHFQVYCSIIHCSQDTDTTQMPTNEQIDKKDTAHVHKYRTTQLRGKNIFFDF